MCVVEEQSVAAYVKKSVVKRTHIIYTSFTCTNVGVLHMDVS